MIHDTLYTILALLRCLRGCLALKAQAYKCSVDECTLFSSHHCCCCDDARREDEERRLRWVALMAHMHTQRPPAAERCLARLSETIVWSDERRRGQGTGTGTTNGRESGDDGTKGDLCVSILYFVLMMIIVAFNKKRQRHSRYPLRTRYKCFSILLLINSQRADGR